MNRVHIGDLVFEASGEESPDASLVCADLEGWYSSPPMRANVDDRPNSDGAFGSVRNFRSARALRFEGWMRGETASVAREELFDAFAAIQADGAPFPILVETTKGPRTVTATLQGEAEVSPVKGLNRARVVARFICYDPVKYGEAQTASTTLSSPGGGLEYPLGDPAGALYYGDLGNLGRLVLSNIGTADTWPVFVISGTLPDGFYLQNLDTGDVLRYDRIVPAGSTVSIDNRTGEVLVDGVSDASTYLTRDSFFPVPAGGSVVVQFNAIAGSSGTPMLTAEFRSGWW
jgi:hypothetical protein